MVLLGLGNPGPQYARTRHNVGFMVIDRVAELLGVSLRKSLFRRYLYAHATQAGPAASRVHYYLAEPLTYMNRSGEIVPALLRRTGEGDDSLVVVCDTLDLPVGVVRLKRGGASAGHRGLSSIMEALGSGDFMRLYVGIDRPSSRAEVIEYVLSPFDDRAADAVDDAVRRGAEALLSIPERGVEDVMNELNRRTERNGRR
ncbi:aminoacyl-tRNA hydrolase [Salinispira pacifica]